MMKFLPLFPLKLVAYPNELVNLHIFEPQYREMINECYTENKTFGIVTYINNEMKDYGTEMKIDKIVKVYDDGRMDIQTKGISVFRLLEFVKEVPNKLYTGGIVTKIENINDKSVLMSQKILKLTEDLFLVMQLDLSKLSKIKEIVSFEIAHHIGFSIEQEYELLSVKREVVRQKIILEHLKKILPVVKEAEHLRQKVKLNGHFKNLKPPF